MQGTSALEERAAASEARAASLADELAAAQELAVQLSGKAQRAAVEEGEATATAETLKRRLTAASAQIKELKAKLAAAEMEAAGDSTSLSFVCVCVWSPVHM